MAVFRQQPLCPDCKEPIEGIYNNSENFFGDTFLRWNWEGHKCRPENLTKTCRNCTYWRDKSWVENEGIGICDNTIVIEQVKMMNEETVRRFTKNDSDAKFIVESIRFNSEFGCIHFKLKENK
jgi:hypothetical protein